VTNPTLARDYLDRARKRFKALGVLFEEEAFADVVRESQELVELVLKAVLRSFGIRVPLSHDVSEAFTEHAPRLPAEMTPLIPRWCAISKHLRKDRELAFYGSEDLTPSTFYSRADAAEAKSMAEEVLTSAARWIV